MNSIFSQSSPLCLPSLYHNPTPYLHLQTNSKCLNHRISSFSIQSSLTSPQSTICAVTPSEGAVSVINFDDFVEKDWSFLDAVDINSDEVYKQNMDRIISAGKVGEESKILISMSSEGFIDRVVDTCCYKQLLVVHDSLFVLAGIKEKYDKVNCWQGELVYVPEKWAPFDVVFLYFLPGLPFELGQVFGVLSKVSSTGARIVISHPKGRVLLDQQKVQYPDAIISNLPDKPTLENAASHHSFTITEFIDEPASKSPRFYALIFRAQVNNCKRLGNNGDHSYLVMSKKPETRSPPGIRPKKPGTEKAWARMPAGPLPEARLNPMSGA